jgi:cardiolipin synthase A/B
MNINWLLVHFLPSLGFILALILLAHILREQRSPTSTFAWLLAIIFIPYLGVPAYLMFGGRKIIRKIDAKSTLCFDLEKPVYDPEVINPFIFKQDNGVFPLTDDNSITFLTDGTQAFNCVMGAIQDAHHTIYIATFILGRDETGQAIIKALSQKAARGIRVCLLLDDLGSIGISKKFLSPLVDAGGQVAFFMPMVHIPFRGRANLRNHRKMVICDDTNAIIGGMNLASEYMGSGDTTNRWKDLSLMVKGPAVHCFRDIFKADWKFASKKEIDKNPDPRHEIKQGSKGLTQVIVSGPDIASDSLRNAIITAVFRANHRIWIVTPYFVPDEILLESLYIACHRGIEVSIIIPEKSNHRIADLVREGYLRRVQESGANIMLYQPSMLHAKAILFDDSLAMVGSSNMDMRSLLLNYEIALCMYDKHAIKQVESWMLTLKADSLKQQFDPKSKSGIIESVGRLFAPLL